MLSEALWGSCKDCIFLVFFPPDSSEQSCPQIAQEEHVPGFPLGDPRGSSEPPALEGSCHFIFLSVLRETGSLRPVTSNTSSQSEREFGLAVCGHDPEVVGPGCFFQSCYTWSLKLESHMEFSTGGILTVQDGRWSGTCYGQEARSVTLGLEAASPSPGSGPTGGRREQGLPLQRELPRAPSKGSILPGKHSDRELILHAPSCCPFCHQHPWPPLPIPGAW
ncbi:uncharacterized protein [Callorhinus ursinus]|uniref:uncharacterized protein n=1 Tax=Callorhinus ursinus TaxID=34884 RepID=UPI003CCFFB19